MLPKQLSNIQSLHLSKQIDENSIKKLRKKTIQVIYFNAASYTVFSITCCRDPKHHSCQDVHSEWSCSLMDIQEFSQVIFSFNFLLLNVFFLISPSLDYVKTLFFLIQREKLQADVKKNNKILLNVLLLIINIRNLTKQIGKYCLSFFSISYSRSVSVCLKLFNSDSLLFCFKASCLVLERKRHLKKKSS